MHHIHFTSFGSGFPLIILHGLFGSLDNWATLARRFADHFHVLAYDARNHGRSFHDDEFTYAAMAEDLAEFMHSQNIARAHILGHSMGGKTAMQFAATTPERVGKLVVVDISPGAYGNRHDAILEAMNAIDPGSLRSRDEADNALASGIPDHATRQFIMKNLARNERGGFRWKLNLPVLTARYGETGRALPPGTRCDCPTLFVRGERSTYLTDDDMGMIATMFPQSRLATITGAGHWVHADNPDALYGAVVQFLLEEPAHTGNTTGAGGS